MLVAITTQIVWRGFLTFIREEPLFAILHSLILDRSHRTAHLDIAVNDIKSTLEETKKQAILSSDGWT